MTAQRGQGERDYVPFSHRYGFASSETIANWDGMSWRGRHSGEQSYLGDSLFRCACPASGASLTRDRCNQRASQEDRLCDACREHCWAVDDAKRHHRLIDVYGAAS